MRQRALLLCAILTSALLVACVPGEYPNDFFPEMHYSPSKRRLEPERLAPPPGAVPVTGRAPSYPFSQASSLQPTPPGPNPTTDPGPQIYATNCATCHGQNGAGDGPVAQYFTMVPPVSFQSARVRGRTDGQLYWLVTNGIGDMPAFSTLLSEQDRWAVVRTIRQLGGG